MTVEHTKSRFPSSLRDKVDSDTQSQSEYSEKGELSLCYDEAVCEVDSSTTCSSLSPVSAESSELTVRSLHALQRLNSSPNNLNEDTSDLILLRDESNGSNSNSVDSETTHSVLKPFFCYQRTVEKLLKKVASNVYRVPSGISIEKVAGSFINGGEESAFYVVDIGAVERRYVEFVQELPRVQPYFAVKCNPDPILIRVLSELGCSFDCASKAEIKLVRSSGVSGDRIVYANPCKPQHHLTYAIENGVNTVTFDNKDELLKLHRLNPFLNVILRIATEDHDALCPLSSKFGALLDEIPELLNMAKALSVNVVGVAFHVGSGCRSVNAYIDSIRRARYVFDLALEVGLPALTILDIGGGFPGFDGESPVTFREIARGIRGYIDMFFPPGEVKIVAEPGRYFVGSSHTLVTRIHGRRFRARQETAVEDAKEKKEKECVDYYIDDGVYGSFRDVLTLGISFYPKFFSSQSSRRMLKSTIFGPTCDSIDCIIRDHPMPELEIGDWIYFEDMGAYTISLASSFNGFSKPSCKYIYGL
eukprot:jgi/Galph1/4538/GphlegSOOS_G3130.1